MRRRQPPHPNPVEPWAGGGPAATPERSGGSGRLRPRTLVRTRPAASTSRRQGSLPAGCRQAAHEGGSPRLRLRTLVRTPVCGVGSALAGHFTRGLPPCGSVRAAALRLSAFPPCGSRLCRLALSVHGRFMISGYFASSSAMDFQMPQAAASIRAVVEIPRAASQSRPGRSLSSVTCRRK
ncbi:MAG: hypothetical protein RLZZ436_823 [Planctomycetota bacterium]